MRLQRIGVEPAVPIDLPIIGELAIDVGEGCISIEFRLARLLDQRALGFDDPALLGEFLRLARIVRLHHQLGLEGGRDPVRLPVALDLFEFRIRVGGFRSLHGLFELDQSLARFDLRRFAHGFGRGRWRGRLFVQFHLLPFGFAPQGAVRVRSSYAGTGVSFAPRAPQVLHLSRMPAVGRSTGGQNHSLRTAASTMRDLMQVRHWTRALAPAL